MDSIRFNHVKITAQKNKKKILKLLDCLIKKGNFFNSDENEKLIKNLSDLFPKKFVVLTSSGHDALLISLLSLHLKNDDEVIFPVNSYPTAFPICISGCKPVPVDVNINGQLDFDTLRKKVTNKTKAIILVHLFGLLGDLEKIVKLAKGENITLIEDCAQAFGSKYKNKLVGSFGDISCFSFYPTKNVGTLGDGGAIITKNKKIYDLCKSLCVYGEKDKYKSRIIAGHSRMPEIQAGILNIFFENIKGDFEKRSKMFKVYLEKIKNEKLRKYIRPLISDKKSNPVPHLFVVEAKKRDSLKKFLKEKGIETAIHYPLPVHFVEAFFYLNLKKGEFPVAEKLSKNILSLPFHPYLTYSQVNYIVKTIKDFYV